jgi:hypothetical protein
MRPVILSGWLTALCIYLLVRNVVAIDVNPDDESTLILHDTGLPQMTYIYVPDSLSQRCRQDCGLYHDGLL